VPTYQYVCTECGGQIETVQKFTDDPLTVHDACGGRLRKVFSPVGIVFKGSGFYRTDSRNGSSSGSSSVNGSASKDSSSRDSSSKDSSSGSAPDGSSSSSSSGAKKASPSSSSSSSSGSSGEKVA
jgi:putative FmdB family regulatory protein